MVTNIRAGAFIQDKTAVDASGDPSKVDWMDYYHCKEEVFVIPTKSWVCSAFQPENNTTNGLSQGYPRFGTTEYAAGFITYVQVLNDANPTVVKNDWVIRYNGAQTLMAIAAAASVALLTF